MSLRLITGRSGTGKTHLCYTEIAKKQYEENGNHLILIVPEQFSLQAEKDLIKKTIGKGIMQAQVLSFRRLAYHIFSEKGGSKKTILSDIGKNMALRKILFDREDQLEYFRKSVDKQGFMQQLGMTISELFQYDISKDKLAEIQQQTDEKSIVKMKLKDLSVIYDGYLEFIKREYISSDETLDILAEKMEGSQLITNGEIWLDGFYGFTPQEYKVIGKLLSNAARVNITLTIDEKSFYNKKMSMAALFFETADTSKRLIELATGLNVAIEKTVFLKQCHRFQTDTMRILEKEYFYHNARDFECNENIRIFAAANRYNETSDTGRQIIELVRDKGIRYRDIAIVTGALGDYEKNLKGVMREYNIPYFIDSKKDIISHPLIELVRSAVDIIVHDFSYESIFRYLKTNLTKTDRTDVDILENYVLAYGIKGYKWHNDEWNYGFKKNPEDEKKEQINAIKNHVLEPLNCIYEVIKKDKKYSVCDITSAVFKLLDCLNVTDKLAVWIEKMTVENNLSKANEHKQSWTIMTGVFEKMVSILGKEIMTIEQYGKVLDAGFAECDMGIIPPGVDQIIIGDIERTRLPDIKALFVLGVNDGILPVPNDPEGLFTDTERGAIEGMGVELAHSSKRKAFEEQYLIYCGITKPSDYISFSYSMGDLNGKSMRPSIIISKIKKIFPNVIEEIDGKCNTGLKEISCAVPTMHLLGTKLRAYADGEEFDDVWKDVYSVYKENKEWSNKTETITNGLFDTNQEGSLSRVSVQKLYGDNFRSSISRLEKFVSCPYSYFVQYGLKVKERQLYQINTPDLGSLFHSVLEKFSNRLLEENRKWRDLYRQDAEDMIEDAVDQVAPELGNEILLSSSSYQYLIKRLKRISKRAVWTLTVHIKRGTFEPFGFEIGFGKQEKLPPIIIELSNGEKMVMEGKIDRIDILDKNGVKYVKIIDYKSGQKAFSLQDIYYGMQLQLMLYLEAFIDKGESLADEKLFPGGVFYFKITDPMISTAGNLSGEEIERLLLKELKMSGLVLLNSDVIKGMDDSFCTTDASKGEMNTVISEIIPVGVSASGAMRKDSSVASMEDYTAIMDYAGNKAREIGNSIMEGNIEISPYKSKQFTPCSYCQFKPICRFDTVNEDNKYRNLKSFKKDEIWEKIKE